LEIEHDLKVGIKCFVLAGFLFEHCVQSTAVDLFAKLLKEGVEVVIARDLVASRSKKYLDGTVNSVFNKLAGQGLKISNWQSIHP